MSLACKNFNIFTVPFGLIKRSCNNLFCFGLSCFWLDHVESAGHMTKIIHTCPEDGALTLSYSAISQLVSWRLHRFKTFVSLTWTQGLCCCSRNVDWESFDMSVLYGSKFVLRSLALRTDWRIAYVYSRTPGIICVISGKQINASELYTKKNFADLVLEKEVHIQYQACRCSFKFIKKL